MLGLIKEDPPENKRELQNCSNRDTASRFRTLVFKCVQLRLKVRIITSHQIFVTQLLSEQKS